MKTIQTLIIFSLLIMLVWWGIHNYTSTNSSDYEPEPPAENQQISSIVTNKSEPSVETESNKLLAVKSIDENDIGVKDGQSSGISDAATNKFESETQEFINSSTFDSVFKLDRTFVSEQNVVNKHPLEIVFRSPSFDRIVEKMNSMEGDQGSEERQQKLYEQLSTLLGNNFHDEQYACKGKICLVRFNYGNSASEDVLSKLRDFDTNYVFSSKRILDNNDITYTGVFIATEDASSMTISQ